MVSLLKSSFRVLRRVELPCWVFVALSSQKPKFFCPVCSYRGPFRDVKGRSTNKKNTKCPQCGSTERIRMLWVVVDKEFPLGSRNGRRVVHFAAEPLIAHLLQERFEVYESSSFDGAHADHAADLRDLPFEDNSYDVLIASHVLEHIKEDCKAIEEIYRVLTPGGKAILPVPLSAGNTEEYDAPRPEESNHVRAPGTDYFDRYRDVFDDVSIRSAEEFPADMHLVSEMLGALPYHYIPVCQKR